MLEALIHKKKQCPYCFESIDITIDPSLEKQRYIEDCFVCCRPITVKVHILSEDHIELNLHSENEAHV